MACPGVAPGARFSALILLFLAVSPPGPAGAVYEKIRVPYPAGRPAAELFFHPDLEVMNDDDGAWILLSRPEITSELRRRGFPVQVLVPDLEEFYAARSKLAGDYGVWHTYQETVDEMHLLHSQFPGLTTAPSSIATTGEGRTVWAMKVSDNPEVEEDEAEVLFYGAHHAREIMAVEGVLHFMRYLCENYAGDAAIRYLVDNRQIWFVPLVNADGFVYNETTHPDGGGMWRKNRRLDPGGCYGVDPNRNYPFAWGGAGSSGSPCEETYQGPEAGSEPEIAGFMSFINAHRFVTWQSYHSVAGMVLFPWGYTTDPTEDDEAFRAIAARMASRSGYAIGQAPELLYLVNGGATDWGYGATSEHSKIFAFTTEFGGSDFWPLPSERDGLIAENLDSNIYLCQVAGPHLVLDSLLVAGGDGNGRLDPGETCTLLSTVENPGVLVTVGGVRLSISCPDPYITLTDTESSPGEIAPGARADNTADPFEVSASARCPAGHDVTFTVRLEADGGLRLEETRSLTVGQLPVLYASTFEEPGSEWLPDPSQTCLTGAFVRADPVDTAFQPGNDTTPGSGRHCWFTAQNPNGAAGADDVDGGIAAARSPLLDLSGVTDARLDMRYFHGQQDPGDDPADGFRIDISNDNGSTWINLVAIGDVGSAATWQSLRVELQDVLPLTAQMLLRVQVMDPGTYATGDVIEGGIDDVYIFDASPPDTVAVTARLTAGPNPATGSVRLRYHAPASAYARLEIYDTGGRRLRALEGPRWSEGWQEVAWDAEDDAGRRVPAGVYHVRLVLPTETRTVRVVQIR